MKKFYLLLTFIFLGVQMLAQDYTPLTITSGFNEDVIAEDTPASTHTTAAVDATSSGANNAFMSINYPKAKVGLPANGLITSIATATPGLTFQLAPYDQNNSLKINANNGTGTLAVQTTNKLIKLYLLATSGSSPSTFMGIITFTDGTTQTFSSQSVPDWYDQGTPAIAIRGIGRVPRTGTQNPDNNTTNPKLFQVAIDISPDNQNKIIQQVALTKTSSTSGFLHIFALSGEITPTCFKPENLGIQNLTATSVDLTWTSAGNTFDIKWGERGFNVATAGTLVTGFANGGTLSGLTADMDYDYYVRRDCGAVDGVSAWAGPFQFRTGYCIPTGAGNNGDEIRNFKLSNLNNNSNASEGTAGYKDYSGTVEPAILEIGEAYIASLTSGTGTGNHGAAIWIDYNNNLVFESNEKVSVIASTIASSTTANFPSFTVPATVEPGIYRLRVQYHYLKGGADLDPCSLTSTYGETEDYAVQIIPAPTCFPPLNIKAKRITKNSVQVVWDAPILGTPPALGYKIEVRTSGRPGDATGLVRTLTTTNLSETLTGLSAETEYLIYVQSLCAATDESTWSRISFTTLCEHPDYELTTSATDLTFCGSREVTLTVDTQGIVNWYNSQTSTTPIHTGNTYTATVSATSSFWYEVTTPESATGPLNAAAVSTSSGNWGTEWDVYFTILESTKLKSIDIYPSTAGQTGRMTFKQRGATGSATVGTINYTTVGANRTVKQVVPIDIQLLPGTYVIETTLPSNGMLRNTSGASYPYSSAVASITGNEYLPSYYMGYYNWIFETGCKSLREEVVVIVNDVPDMPVSSATLTYIYGDIATALTATADTNNSLLWYTTETAGTGTNTAPTPTTDAVGTQTYWVSQVTANGCESERTKIEVVINQATLTITANSGQSKVYGETDPVLTYSVSGFQGSDDESILTGALDRTAGEDAGTYPITQGDLSAGANYVIDFTSADFEITKATLTVIADDNQGKIYGEDDPTFTYTVTGFQGS
ncbi:MBG domain-containing protein, partial [Myroides indicus]